MKSMQFDKAYFTRGLPKTGCITEVWTGDDGTYQAGWWVGLDFAGNRTRFVSATIGVDVITMDNATGLMWAALGNRAGCNNGEKLALPEAIAYANGLTFAGYSDWRIPNIFELVSIVNYGEDMPKIYIPFFPNTEVEEYWSSTHYYDDVNSNYRVSFLTGFIDALQIGVPQELRCVRNGL